MTLRELLKEIDFDYVIENGEIRLIDEQDAYLGSIAEDRWAATQESVLAIIDRMDIYWNDYVYDDLANPNLNVSGEPLDGYKGDGNYEKQLEYCETQGIKNYLTEILYFIVHPDEVVLEEARKTESRNSYVSHQEMLLIGARKRPVSRFVPKPCGKKKGKSKR